VGSGDRPGTKRIEERGVVATQFDVVEYEPTAHHVVCEVENVVRIAVRTPSLQEPQPRVERFDESDVVRELVHGANAATRNRVTVLCNFATDLASAKLGAIPARCLLTLCLCEACCDLPCCRRELSP